MEKIGFFGGCFNPPTIAHLELAKIVLKEFNLDKIVFVPMSDFYIKKGLISQEHRYNMLKLLTKDEENLEISNFEFECQKRLYAIDAFKMIDEMYDCEKYFIMGSDNYINIGKWKSSEELKKYNYIILDRLNKIENVSNIRIVNNNDFSKISSSKVRSDISSGKDISKYITEDVYNYIKQNKLYLKNED